MRLLLPSKRDGCALTYTQRARYIGSMSFSVSVAAARRVAEIMASEPGAKALRVEVLAGGCSGLQYKFDLTDAQAADDVVVAHDGATVLVDPVSLEFLAGAQLDFNDDLMGAHFAIKNPNATSSCGCGTSFSVD
jgi:iron-sulfur cluster insertion protein